MRREAAARVYAGIGSRRAPPRILLAANLLARRLARFGWTCRTGGAVGMDRAFLDGSGGRVELYLPRPGFEGHRACRLARPTPKAVSIASEHHPKWPSLSKAARALLARNTHQILGAACDSPCTIVICWTPDGAERAEETSEATGGTGQAIRVADAYGVPVLNLAREDRLAELDAGPGEAIAKAVALYVPKTLPVLVV